MLLYAHRLFLLLDLIVSSILPIALQQEYDSQQQSESIQSDSNIKRRSIAVQQSLRLCGSAVMDIDFNRSSKAETERYAVIYLQE